jgi:hypothetical protein
MLTLFDDVACCYHSHHEQQMTNYNLAGYVTVVAEELGLAHVIPNAFFLDKPHLVGPNY